MSLPPKSDDESASKTGSAATKRARRGPRTRPRKTKDAAADTPELPIESSTPPPAPAPEPAAAAEPSPAPARERSRSRSRDREPAAEAPPERPPERMIFTPDEPPAPPPPAREPEPAAPEPRNEAPAPAPSAAPSDAPSAGGDNQSQDRGDQGAPSGDSQGQQGQPRDQRDQRPPQQNGGGGGGGGQWQDRDGGGGGGEGRDFWKRNKRGKRGRHGGGGGGGQWQGGGGQHGGGQHGGGGGNRDRGPQHPPQPPPPSNAPIYGELPNPSRFNDLAALDASATEKSSGSGEAWQLNEIYAFNLADLTAFARKNNIAFEGVPNKKQLLTLIFASAANDKRALRDKGYIDVTDRGAFIVHEHVNYRLYPDDAYLPDSLVRRYGLKRGHRVEVLVQSPLEGERCPSVVRIESVMGMAPDEVSKITPFEELIPYYPLKRILLEPQEAAKDVSMRAVDILTPIGFGQRALIVAPPRTGKTVLLQNIANSITENSPEAKLILLLIDERPEEVTDFKRHTKGEVVSSTFDETPESHVHCAEMVIENARRRVELGEHVVILLDSITRLARAYNALTGNQGKTMSGGLESNALQKPKRFFGSARNIEGGGSLTIIASALIDTGSRMDEIIFEEFKGTGNCELHLDRGLVERRVFPAINIDRSGTRKEELIYHPDELQRIYGLRRAMQGLGPIESMEMLITRLRKTKSNAEFLITLAR